MDLYKISFLPHCSNKIYIGISSKGAALRFAQHCQSKKKYPIVEAIKKYGRENAVLEIIGTYDNWDDLYLSEQVAISKYGSKSPHGYNLTDGGKGCFGMPASEERKRKIGEANRGRKMSDSQRKKLSEIGKNRDNSKCVEAMRRSNLGGHLSENQKSAINWSGKTHSEESKRKMSESAKKRPGGFKGMIHSAETKAKISETKKNQWMQKNGMSQL